MKYTGLTFEEVKESIKLHGENILEVKKKETLLNKIINTIKEPMFFLLITASLIYFILGEYLDGIIMLIFVLGICGVEIVQEEKTDRAVEELNNLSSINITVIRNGQKETIKSSEVVVGDILLLEEGDIIPADGEVLESNSVGIDESLLTGEAAIIYKGKNDVCYSGTCISVGNLVFKVTKVGKNTEYGKIGTSLNNIVKNKTPLEKQTSKIVKISFICCIICFISVITINLIFNPSHDILLKDRIIHSILSGITIAMATIPEEIPVILTVFLSLGAYRLSKEKVLTRSMKSVETLGAVSVLCVDKTGTLTQNKMIVKDTYELTEDYNKILTLACPKDPHDPMEKAILEYTEKKGIKKTIFNNYLRYEYLFNNKDKMMGNLWDIKGELLLTVKGAVETILPLCKDINKEEILTKVKRFSSLGYRVLAVAKCSKVDEVFKKIKDYNLEFCGLVAFIDPPKSKVIESIQDCYKAGIRVVMITGDSKDTALGIANQIKLVHNDIAITGDELENMTDNELKEQVKICNVFARVYPNHKMRIVEALQKNDEVVAMTGDGVNDAPALKKAEIGIAMGKRGTNVAKEAADMILLDDNFNTIVDAIFNGRSIYNNIKRAICYIIIIHIPFALISILVPLFNLPPLLYPIHVVLLELIIDPTSTIILERIKPDIFLMNKKPRKINESIVNMKMFYKCLLQGLFITLAFFLSYLFLIKNNYSYNFAVTFSFIVLVMSNLFVVTIIQSDKLGLLNLIDNLKDKVITSINFIIVLTLILLTYTKLSILTNMKSISIQSFILAIIVAFVSTYIFDIFKYKFKK